MLPSGLTSPDIGIATLEQADDLKDQFVHPVWNDRSVVAKPRDQEAVLLTNMYDAMPKLGEMIGHVEAVLQISFLFFRGLPVNLNVVIR